MCGIVEPVYLNIFSLLKTIIPIKLNIQLN